MSYQNNQWPFRKRTVKKNWFNLWDFPKILKVKEYQKSNKNSDYVHNNFTYENMNCIFVCTWKLRKTEIYKL